MNSIVRSVVIVSDFAAKNRLLILAYISETEPVTFGLLVTLVLSGLSMDYFAFHEALNGVLESELVISKTLDETDASGKPRIGYLLSEKGKQVWLSLQDQLKPSELEWLKENAPHYRAQYEETDLSGTYYRQTDDGYIVSLGQTKSKIFKAHYTFLVETEKEAKKAVERFRVHADGVNRYLKETLLSD